MSDNPTPEAGQVWADNDERSTYPEFTILAIEPGPLSTGYAVVQRGPIRKRIRLDRLANNGSRGYRYIGRSR